MLPHLTYILSIIIFCGAAIAALLFVATKKEERMLRRYNRVILMVALIAIPFTLTEFFALKWQAWSYFPEQTLNIKLGAEVETYVYAVAVSFVLAVAALVSASRIDRARTQKSNKNRRK